MLIYIHSGMTQGFFYKPDDFLVATNA